MTSRGHVVRNDAWGKHHDEDLLIVAELLAQQTFKSGSLVALHIGHIAESGVYRPLPLVAEGHVVPELLA